MTALYDDRFIVEACPHIDAVPPLKAIECRKCDPVNAVPARHHFDLQPGWAAVCVSQDPNKGRSGLAPCKSRTNDSADIKYVPLGRIEVSRISLIEIADAVEHPGRAVDEGGVVEQEAVELTTACQDVTPTEPGEK